MGATVERHDVISYFQIFTKSLVGFYQIINH